MNARSRTLNQRRKKEATSIWRRSNFWMGRCDQNNKFKFQFNYTGTTTLLLYAGRALNGAPPYPWMCASALARFTLPFALSVSGFYLMLHKLGQHSWTYSVIFASIWIDSGQCIRVCVRLLVQLFGCHMVSGTWIVSGFNRTLKSPRLFDSY